MEAAVVYWGYVWAIMLYGHALPRNPGHAETRKSGLRVNPTCYQRQSLTGSRVCGDICLRNSVLRYRTHKVLLGGLRVFWMGFLQGPEHFKQPDLFRQHILQRVITEKQLTLKMGQIMA